MWWIPSGPVTVFRPPCCSPCVRPDGSEPNRSRTRIPKSSAACFHLHQAAPPSHVGAPAPIHRDRLMLARDCLGFCRFRTAELHHKTLMLIIDRELSPLGPLKYRAASTARVVVLPLAAKPCPRGKSLCPAEKYRLSGLARRCSTLDLPHLRGAGRGPSFNLGVEFAPKTLAKTLAKTLGRME